MFILLAGKFMGFLALVGIIMPRESERIPKLLSAMKVQVVGLVVPRWGGAEPGRVGRSYVRWGSGVDTAAVVVEVGYGGV